MNVQMLESNVRCITRRHSVMIWCAVSVDARLNVNVALNRPSFQVSTLGVYEASRANDGNNNTNMFAGSCANTGITTNPWWAVDLGVALYVHGVKFTNRTPNGTYTALVPFIKSTLFSLSLYCILCLVLSCYGRPA